MILIVDTWIDKNYGSFTWRNIAPLDNESYKMNVLFI